MYHKAPFLCLTVALAAGILTAYLLPAPLPWIEIAIGGTACIATALFIDRCVHPHPAFSRYLFAVGLFPCLFAFGGMRLQRERLTPPPCGKRTHYTAVVKDVPVPRKKTLRLNTLARDSAGVHFHLILYLTDNADSRALRPGDQLEIHAQPQETDFAYYTSHDIHRQAFVNENNWRKIGYSSRYNFLNSAIRLRDKLLQRLRQTLPPDTYTLAAALTLGYKQDVEAETRNIFTQAGTSHLLAVSGLHIGFIYAALHLLLSWPTRRNGIRAAGLILQLAGLWGYIYLCGLPASAIRSGIMFTLLGIANLTHRTAVATNSLFSAAFIMLFWHPFYLFDVGFQLSFSAVLGILCLSGALHGQRSASNGLAGKLGGMTVVSVTAQLGTLPCCLYYFQQFPLYFPVSNLIAVPMATLLVYGTLGLMVTAGIPGISPLLASVVDYGFRWLIGCLQWIGRLPSAILHTPGYDLTDAVLTALLTALSIQYLRCRKARWLDGALVCIIFLICRGIVQDFCRIFPTFACNS